MASLPTVRKAAASKALAPKARMASVADEEEPDTEESSAGEEPPPTPAEVKDNEDAVEKATIAESPGEAEEPPAPAKASTPSGEPMIPEGTPRGRASIRASLHKTPGGSWVRVGPKPRVSKPTHAQAKRYYNKGTGRMETARHLAARRVTKR